MDNAPIRIGILGYGNLGRGVECAVHQNSDMTLAAVFTRRSPETLSILTPDVPIVSAADILNWQDRIDVLILCGGSATDLPVQTLQFSVACSATIFKYRKSINSCSFNCNF